MVITKEELEKRGKVKLIFKISILLIGVLVCFFVVFFISNFIYEYNYINERELVLSEQEIINNCGNLNLVNTSICLRDSIETFFIYNITDDELFLNFDELKERGGDCRNWAFLYQKLGKELNFSASTVKNGELEGVFNAHRYAVLWNDNLYCKLDMLNDVECYIIEY